MNFQLKNQIKPGKLYRIGVFSFASREGRILASCHRDLLNGLGYDLRIEQQSRIHDPLKSFG